MAGTCRTLWRALFRLYYDLHMSLRARSLPCHCEGVSPPAPTPARPAAPGRASAAGRGSNLRLNGTTSRGGLPLNRRLLRPGGLAMTLTCNHHPILPLLFRAFICVLRLVNQRIDILPVGWVTGNPNGDRDREPPGFGCLFDSQSEAFRNLCGAFQGRVGQDGKEFIARISF
jgi:hypothetical protein